MDLKELWNTNEISISLKNESSKNAKNHKSLDLLSSFQRKLRYMFMASITLSIIILSIYTYMNLYELAFMLLIILLINNYIAFNFFKKIKKNRFVLNLKEYLKETAAILTSYIKFNIYALIFALLFVIPSLYIVGMNSLLKTTNLFSIVIFKEHPNLLVGLGVSLLLSALVSLSILYRVYYRILKKVNSELKELNIE